MSSFLIFLPAPPGTLRTNQFASALFTASLILKSVPDTISPTADSSSTSTTRRTPTSELMRRMTLPVAGSFDLLRHPLNGEAIAHAHTGLRTDVDDHLLAHHGRDQPLDRDGARDDLAAFSDHRRAHVLDRGFDRLSDDRVLEIAAPRN